MGDLWRWFYRRMDESELERNGLPSWFGIAWWDLWSRKVVVLRIPLNILAHYARAVFWGLYPLCKGQLWRRGHEYRIHDKAYAIGCAEGARNEARDVARTILHALPAEERLGKMGSTLLMAELADVMKTEPIVAAVIAACRNTLGPERDVLLLIVREMAKQMAAHRELLKRRFSVVTEPFSCPSSGTALPPEPPAGVS